MAILGWPVGIVHHVHQEELSLHAAKSSSQVGKLEPFFSRIVILRGILAIKGSYLLVNPGSAIHSLTRSVDAIVQVHLFEIFYFMEKAYSIQGSSPDF
jgi:hypothetical protein